MTLDLGFTGDVMLGRGVDTAQRRRPSDAVWGDLHERLRTLDGLFVNLECCLSTRGTPAEGRPFHFRADPDWAVRALEGAGVDWCALANNHLMDFGPEALADTVEALDRADIAHAGAGESAAVAEAPALVTVGDLSVGLVSFTDNTPAFAAGPATPGTAHVTFDVDDAESRRAVAEALDGARARDPDLLVASLHWGPNMETDPPEEFRTFGRWLVDRGVDEDVIATEGLASEEPAETVLADAEAFDIVIVAEREPTLTGRLTDTIAEKVFRESTAPVVLVRLPQ
ncbi:MAG: CapA family protein [Bradymonadaceae bacterium]